MTAYEPDAGEPPLDAAAERLRRRLARLLMISGGFMVLGLIAVFSAIVYKVRGAGDATPAEFGTELLAEAPVDAPIVIPAGGRLVSTALDGSRALLTIEGADGAVTLLLVDLRSGQALGRYPLRRD